MYGYGVVGVHSYSNFSYYIYDVKMNDSSTFSQGTKKTKHITNDGNNHDILAII